MTDATDEGTGEAAALEVAEPGLDWSCRLMAVERIHADPDDDDAEDIFTVTIQVEGPDASAEAEVIVSDAEDAEVVPVALHCLHVAMKRWAAMTEHHRLTTRLKPPA